MMGPSVPSASVMFCLAKAFAFVHAAVIVGQQAAAAVIAKRPSPFKSFHGAPGRRPTRGKR